MSYNAKVCRAQGGDRLVVQDGGEIAVEPGGRIVVDGAEPLALPDLATDPPDLAEVVEQLEQLKDILRGLGIVAAA